MKTKAKFFGSIALAAVMTFSAFGSNDKTTVCTEHTYGSWVRSCSACGSTQIQLQLTTNQPTREERIPVIQRLELMELRTGYYRSESPFSNQILFCPIVIMQWRNKSETPLDERVEIKAVFINKEKNEEWSNESTIFQYSSGIGTPLSPGISRQVFVQSDVGYRNQWGLNENIECQLYINGTFFRTVKIENAVLHSNRIQ